MRYSLFTFLIITVVAFRSQAADVRKSTMDPIAFSVGLSVQQDSLSKAKKVEKKAADKDKKEGLPQTEDALKIVPKARNKAIPRAIVVPSIKIKSPRIVPIKVKVKVNTQVKIKL
ncbi:hypothetical protein ACVWYG_000607 [Pedobacter sp. UYEF25]